MMRQVARLARAGDVAGCLALLRGAGGGTAEFNVALRWLPHAAAWPVFELMRRGAAPPDKSTALSLLHFLRADRRKLDAALAWMVELHANDEGAPEECPVPFLPWHVGPCLLGGVFLGGACLWERDCRPHGRWLTLLPRLLRGTAATRGFENPLRVSGPACMPTPGTWRACCA